MILGANPYIRIRAFRVSFREEKTSGVPKSFCPPSFFLNYGLKPNVPLFHTNMYRHLKSNPKASFVQGRHSFGSRSCTLVTCCRWLICLHSLFLGCACSGFELTHQHVKHGPHYKATSNFIHERWFLSSRPLPSFS